MPIRIRQCLTGIGFACLVLSIGFVLATPFLPLSPFWQQMAVGFALIGLQMAIWVGPAMTNRIYHIRHEILKKAGNANPLPTTQNEIYYAEYNYQRK
jgi:hypothetical protein